MSGDKKEVRSAEESARREKRDTGMSRRRFLQDCARWGLIAGTIGILPGRALAEAVEKDGAGDGSPGKEGAPEKPAPPKGNPDLAVCRGKDAGRALDRAVRMLGGWERFVPRGATVVLKPNFSFSRPPAAGANTSPEVVEAAIRFCRQSGAKKIIVADHPLAGALNCVEASGMAEVVRRAGAGVSLLLGDKKSVYRDCPVPKGKELKKTAVMKEVLAADVVINLPAAKSHSAAAVSLGLKGMMGLVWDRGYFHTEIDLNQGIADLATLIRPQLTIMDATRALASGGPGGPGEVIRLDTIVAGIDPVAVDAYTVELVPWYGRKFRGDQVKHIAAAARMGLGEMDTARLKIIEEAVF